MSIGYIPMSADIIHAGHIAVIQKCLDYCDNLIVGLLSDEIIKKYKGHDTIMKFKDRKAILDELISVDYVEKQNTLIPNICGCQFIFSGDGWEKEEIEAAKKWKVKMIDINSGVDISSTEIKNKIKNDKSRKSKAKKATTQCNSCKIR